MLHEQYKLVASAEGDDELFALREFSLTCSRGSEEFYMRFVLNVLMSLWLLTSPPLKDSHNSILMGSFYRWQSFKSGSIFRDRVLGMNPPPHKMDIGAIYSFPVGLVGCIQCRP